MDSMNMLMRKPDGFVALGTFMAEMCPPAPDEPTYIAVSLEPRDGRCVGSRFRVRNDMADQKIEYAAGMPQDISSAAREQASNRPRRRCNGFLLNLPCASHLPSVV
jgi:hypothetical protein